MLWIYYGRRLGALFGILSVALFFLIIGVMEFQVRNRGGMLEVLAGSGAGYGTVGDGDSTTFNPLESHRDNNLYFLALIVRGIPHDYPHEGLNDYFAYIVNPIPRAVWPGKPVLSGARNLREINPVYQSGPLSVGTTSLSSSIVGEAFLWSGYLGFFLLYGIYMPFCSWFDSWFVHEPKNNVIQIGIQGFAAFLALWGYRSLNAFVTFSYVFLLLYLGAMVASKLRYSLNSYSTALRAEVNP
jgi:hypothetical protein